MFHFRLVSWFMFLQLICVYLLAYPVNLLLCLLALSPLLLVLTLLLIVLPSLLNTLPSMMFFMFRNLNSILAHFPCSVRLYLFPIQIPSNMKLNVFWATVLAVTGLSILCVGKDTPRLRTLGSLDPVFSLMLLSFWRIMNAVAPLLAVLPLFDFV